MRRIIGRLSVLVASVAIAVSGTALVGATPAGAAPAEVPQPTGGPAALSPIPGQGPPTDPVFRLAGGCYALQSVGNGKFVQRADSGYAAAADAAAALGFRAQAAQLGQFLFYGADNQMIATKGGQVIASATAIPTADWTVSYADGGSYAGGENPEGTYTITNTATGERLGVAPGSDALTPLRDGAARVDGEFTLAAAAGCASFPESEVNAAGDPSTGTGATARGYVDTHVHMATEGFLGGMVHCGAPFSPLGITVALKDCADHGASGETALLEKVLSGEDPLAPHDTAGWPNFENNPTAGTQTHEQTYYRSVERSWRGGQRIMTNLFVTNDVLCQLYPLKDTTCDGMAVMRLQYQQLHSIQDYVDAQYGGPGRGWFRIVTTPAQAREVVSAGRLAVVMGVEISDLFGCTISDGVPQCDEADIDAGLDELKAMGLQQVVLVHKFDNALGGTRMDGGVTGAAVNIGNFIATGRFWQTEQCTPLGDDNAQPLTVDGAAALAALPAATTLPIYEPGADCNTIGLTSLGEYAVRGMMARQLTVDIDHLSTKAADQLLSILEQARYPRVISSHGWTSDSSYGRVLALGGFIGAYGSGADDFVEDWRAARALSPANRLFGYGYGSDTNGFAGQAQPRTSDTAGPVAYPFTAFDGTVLDRQRMGNRLFDVNTDGRAQYGLTPDWIEDGRLAAGADGAQFQDDMANGAEAYLRTWEGR